LLKSVHIYQSYRQNNPGGPFFGTPCSWLGYIRSWYTRPTIGVILGEGRRQCFEVGTNPPLHESIKSEILPLKTYSRQK